MGLVSQPEDGEEKLQRVMPKVPEEVQAKLPRNGYFLRKI